MKNVLVLFLVLTCMLSLTACGKATGSEELGAVSDTLDIGENVFGETEQTQQGGVESISGTVSNETVDVLEDNEHEISHINIREDIISTDEVKKQGGIIEFADNMTYKEFLDLNWVNDVDESLTNDTKVYIVKIYYPNGYEHYKIGLINKCEAIGIYRAEDGEYLGGSFKERSK
jgi:hypothetical protein